MKQLTITFMDNEQERIYWLVGSNENKPYSTTTWFRCVGLQEFIEKVEKNDVIVGFIANGNNIGFILDERTK